jgi:hypothetical protein
LQAAMHALPLFVAWPRLAVGSNSKPAAMIDPKH